MALCPSGHETSATDYCDLCGRPIGGGVTVDVAEEPTAAMRACPHCGGMNAPDALFCEGCGYDFSTGALPSPELAALLGLPTDTEMAGPGPEARGTTLGDDATTSADDEPTGAVPLTDDEPTGPVPLGDDAPTGSLPRFVDDAPADEPVRQVWVAEIWVDPDWYAVQVTEDPLPSVAPPRLVRLAGTSALVGRYSPSRGVDPEIDCDPDSACSRRQARLTFDGIRWFVEDLESSNGTYVGAAGGPLPRDPISGKAELGPDDRIYVGAWTRIVVRQATLEELTTA